MMRRLVLISLAACWSPAARRMKPHRPCPLPLRQLPSPCTCSRPAISKTSSPWYAKIEAATGVRAIPLRRHHGEHAGSADRRLRRQAPRDVAWFANAKYLLSDAAGQGKVKMQEKIALAHRRGRE